jgi:hypothetical protein
MHVRGRVEDRRPHSRDFSKPIIQRVGRHYPSSYRTNPYPKPVCRFFAGTRHHLWDKTTSELSIEQFHQIDIAVP